MAEPEKRMAMTETEFRKFVDEAFDNGALATFDVLAEVIAALRNKIPVATQGGQHEEDDRG